MRWLLSVTIVPLLLVAVSGCVHHTIPLHRPSLHVAVDPHTVIKSEDTALLCSEVVQYLSEQGYRIYPNPAIHSDYVLKLVVTDHDICNTSHGLTRMSYGMRITVTLNGTLIAKDGTLVWQGPVTAHHVEIKPQEQHRYSYVAQHGSREVYRRLAAKLHRVICQNVQ